MPAARRRFVVSHISVFVSRAAGFVAREPPVAAQLCLFVDRAAFFVSHEAVRTARAGSAVAHRRSFVAAAAIAVTGEPFAVLALGLRVVFHRGRETRDASACAVSRTTTRILAGSAARGIGSGPLTMQSSKENAPRFVVCVANDEYPVALELHKIYIALPDEVAAADGDLRVIDESGEDYLYPASYFLPIRLRRETEKALESSFSRFKKTA